MDYARNELQIKSTDEMNMAGGGREDGEYAIRITPCQNGRGGMRNVFKGVERLELREVEGMKGNEVVLVFIPCHHWNIV